MRKIFTFLILILVLVLAGITGYVALNIGESPIDFSVADNNCCEGDNCSNYNGDWGAGYTACVNGQCSKCQGGGAICGNGSCQSSENHSTCPADCPATTSGSGSTGSGSTTGTTCVANKTEGAACNPSCGNNACDGSGPLGCNVCTVGSKAGQNVCSSGINNESYGRACGVTKRANGLTCSFNAQCTSNICTSGICSGSTGGVPEKPEDECSTVGQTRCQDCTNQQCKSSEAGNKWVSSGTSCCGGTGSTTTPPGTTTGTKTAGQACTPGNSECANPYVCTLNPQNNTYVCNDPGTTDQRCGTGYSCSGYVAFKCTQLDSGGRCESGQQGIFSGFSQASGTVNGCGQVDQICVNGSLQAELDSSGTYKNCGDFQIFRNSCSGTAQPATQQPNTPAPTIIKKYACNSNFQCVEKSDGAFSTLTSCQTNCVADPDLPLCGDTCQNSSQCPTNHSCTSGKCVLNGCTATTCLNGCSPICGGPCTAGNNATCPTNHTCTSQGKCILTQCVNNTSCTNNGCTLPETTTVIPTTAFGDSSTDFLMLGTLLIIIGLFVYKSKLVTNWDLYLTHVNKINRNRKIRNFESEVKEELERKNK